MKTPSKLTLEDIYNLPLGSALWDSHYDIPPCIRLGFNNEIIRSISLPVTTVKPLLDSVRPNSMNKYVYKVDHSDRFIVLAAAYDFNGMIYTIEL